MAFSISLLAAPALVWVGTAAISAVGVVGSSQCGLAAGNPDRRRRIGPLYNAATVDQCYPLRGDCDCAGRVGVSKK